MLNHIEEDDNRIKREEDQTSYASKVAFTVSIPNEFNLKFNEIQAHLQSKQKYGRVYKNQVLQMIIDEAYNKFKNNRL